MPAGKFRTHYDNLKVARDAPPEVIRAAYRALSQRHHPDKNPGNERAAKIMVIVNASYAVLSDPDARRAHDAWIASWESAEQETSIAEPSRSADDTTIRAEPRRAKSDDGFAFASILNRILEGVGKYAIALVVPLLIIGLIKLPSLTSKISKANSMTPSVRERSLNECNSEMNILRMFMRTAIDPETDAVPVEIRLAFLDTVLSEKRRFAADTHRAAQLIWAQRDDLRRWRRAKVAQKVEVFVERRLRSEAHSLTDWLPLSEANKKSADRTQ
jgi:DnaJ domain